MIVYKNPQPSVAGFLCLTFEAKLQEIFFEMDLDFYQDEIFEKRSFSGQEIRNKEFENCVFQQCDFSESNFSGNRFTDCTFTGCNMALVPLNRSVLNGVTFRDCKLIGVNFTACESSMFSVSFQACKLDFALFSNKKIIKTLFSKCSLKSVDFSGSILTGSHFQECDLENAIFSQTKLDQVNFLTAYNFTIDPEQNLVKKARFSSESLAGLLRKYDLKIE